MSDPIAHPPVPRRPRRSALYVPGANARAIDKAGSLAADTLIFDLEDAVAPDAKAKARDAVTSAVFARDVGRQELVIRINGLDTEWGADDLTAALEAGPDALLLPKVESADDLDTVRRVAGEAREVALWAMIETPRGILAIDEIADELAAGTGTPGLVVGINDLALAMQARLDAGRSAFRLALQVTVLAARARGLIALDGVCNAIGDEARLRAECEDGRTLGFDGKTLIHPGQIETANAVFSPSAAELAEAEAVIAAFDAAPDAGVLKVDGRMVERLHLEAARRIAGGA